jgi:hypothetical protein
MITRSFEMEQLSGKLNRGVAGADDKGKHCGDPINTAIFNYLGESSQITKSDHTVSISNYEINQNRSSK